MTSFFIETDECAHTVADAERMAGLLKQAQFEPVQTMEDADVVILVSCHDAGGNILFTRLENLKTKYPYKILIIAGCIAQADLAKAKKYSWVGTWQIHRIVEAVEEALHDSHLHLRGADEMPPLDLPKIRLNPLLEIIPLSRECFGFCAFCKTRKTGKIESYPVADIVTAARKAVEEGVQQIWLTSHDTMSYGLDIKTHLGQLLKELVSVPGNFKIKVGKGNPAHFPRIKDDVIPWFAHDKMFKLVHLPFYDENTAGDGQEFVAIVDEFREKIPHITIAMDIMIGHPTETEDTYWKKLELLKKTNPDELTLSRFAPKPKTPDAKLPPLAEEIVSHRFKVLTDVFQNISKMNNERWLDWEGEISIDAQGREERQWVGRNFAYKPVIVEGNYKMGDIHKVRIIQATTFDLRGRVINELG
ncbi:MAG: MiaB-like protein tRNA modifying enzyme [archaeon GW2011_AR9]|nr:MAG: MiaB-like protein tRNA modifying enzyme [archaeon GW2011_AR9]MBS3120453.1 radical SAM protein [Candidatus Woesearchaeota archaeon]HIH12610.1 radical SAM protein [Candidatus Woesearchaeota archaeon]